MRMVNKDISSLLNQYYGNFGLYFTKFNEIEEDKDKGFKKSINNEKNLIDVYNGQNKVDKLLSEKHKYQDQYIDSMKNKGYIGFRKRYKLTTKMITGIGSFSFSEIGMTFDYCLGVPYIPASSVKGVVRSIYIMKLISEGYFKNILINDRIEKYDVLKETSYEEFLKILTDKLKNEELRQWTDIYKYFGGKLRLDNEKEAKTYIGNIIFLDIYPEKKPILATEINNVHYRKYYDSAGKLSPIDNENPNPIKYLVIEKNCIFTVRYLVKYKVFSKNQIDYVNKIIEEAFTLNGIGAKTNIGFGTFDLINDKAEEGEVRK